VFLAKSPSKNVLVLEDTEKKRPRTARGLEIRLFGGEGGGGEAD